MSTYFLILLINARQAEVPQKASSYEESARFKPKLNIANPFWMD
jgi:hypothetical protein